MCGLGNAPRMVRVLSRNIREHEMWSMVNYPGHVSIQFYYQMHFHPDLPKRGSVVITGFVARGSKLIKLKVS